MSTALQKRNGKPDDHAVLDRLSRLSTDEVRSRLAECLGQTVENLKEAAVCVRVLEDRGEDMSDLRGSLFNYLRLIAYGQLRPEVVVRFAGSPYLMRNIGALPLPDQERLGNGESVEVAVRRGSSFDTRKMSPLDLGPHQARQVFSGGRLRSIPEQIAHLEAAPDPEPERSSSVRRKARVEADAKTAMLKVGRAKASVGEVLGALGGLATIDPDARGTEGTVTIDSDLYGPLKRMAAAGDTTVRHLVRMAILRTYFGDAAESKQGGGA